MGRYAEVSEAEKRNVVARYVAGESFDDIVRREPFGASTARKWVWQYAPEHVRTSAQGKALKIKRMEADALVFPRWRENQVAAQDRVALGCREVCARFVPRETVARGFYSRAWR